MAPLGLVGSAGSAAGGGTASRRAEAALLSAILPDLCAAKTEAISKSIDRPKTSRKAAGGRAPGKRRLVDSSCASGPCVETPRELAQEDGASEEEAVGPVSGSRHEDLGLEAAEAACGGERSARIGLLSLEDDVMKLIVVRLWSHREVARYVCVGSPRDEG